MMINFLDIYKFVTSILATIGMCILSKYYLKSKYPKTMKYIIDLTLSLESILAIFLSYENFTYKFFVFIFYLFSIGYRYRFVKDE